MEKKITCECGKVMTDNKVIISNHKKTLYHVDIMKLKKEHASKSTKEMSNLMKDPDSGKNYASYTLIGGDILLREIEDDSSDDDIDTEEWQELDSQLEADLKMQDKDLKKRIDTVTAVIEHSRAIKKEPVKSCHEQLTKKPSKAMQVLKDKLAPAFQKGKGKDKK